MTSDPNRDLDQARTPTSDGPVIASSSVDQHCQTIAHVAALATWIDRKLPEILHVALSDGVPPADAAAAAGITVDDLARRWKKWAQQTETLTSADYDRIRRVLVDAEHTA